MKYGPMFYLKVGMGGNVLGCYIDSIKKHIKQIFPESSIFYSVAYDELSDRCKYYFEVRLFDDFELEYIHEKAKEIAEKMTYLKDKLIIFRGVEHGKN